MDAITLLRDDHQAVEKLFKRYEETTDRAIKTRRSLVDKMIEELAVHAELEEQLFYPAVRALDPDDESEVLEALEEHHIVTWLLSELEGMPAEHPRFHAKVTVLIELVRHHVEEEEEDLFPGVRDTLGRKELQALGENMRDLKPHVPTRPHPRTPDEPPGNIIAAAGGKIVDNAKEALEAAVKSLKR